jgi:catechol 2,3-dioxygenase-like lactoylglutathione lyase family enzyme
MRIGSVVIECNDFEAMWRFWAEALHYIAREEPEDGWVVLRDPRGPNVNLSFQKVQEPRTGKNRLHFDLYTENQAAEVERLLALGATRHPRNAEPGEDFVVLADPDGNLFCVVEKRGG